MRLLWRVYICFLLCIIMALAASAWYTDYSLRQFYEDQVAGDLLVRARVLASELAPCFPDAQPAEIDRRCKEFGRLTPIRATVVVPGGRVIGDSDENPSSMENHTDRPEVATAMTGQTGKSVRFSDTIRRTLMYLAIPVMSNGQIVAVVRSSVPLAVIDTTLSRVYRHIAYGGVVMAVLSAVLAFYLSRRISRPLEELGHVAGRLAKGDLDARVTPADDGEAGTLARALNQMASQLKERIDTLGRQSNEQKAVLSSMVEGVLAVDTNERILGLNESAARLLDLVPGQARGRSIQEAVRNLDLQSFIKSALAAGGSSEADIAVHGAEERFLQLNGTVLADTAGARLGILIVLNDVTRLKRLETVRRDFVANVSHELKTPITTLKGCIDTLSGDAHLSLEDTERFLGMMRRHAERLDAIVEDLLTLSRIEHDIDQNRVTLAPGTVCEVLRTAVQGLAGAAVAKKIAVETECSGDLVAPINAHLLEHAIGNLIDNAIKFSEQGTRVAVSAALVGEVLEISVADQGPGIEKQHLDRIFERFYRVDSARSRGLGGTGLGLSIVKHAVLAHNGTVTVESMPGHGSIFRIRIPVHPA